MTAPKSEDTKRSSLHGAKCDFCVPARLAIWEYPARSFQVEVNVPGVKGLDSRGGWLACDGCAFIIERGNQAALLKRITVPLNETEMEVQQRLVGAFFENRLGERISFG